MGRWAALLLVLALVLGGVGLLIDALRWILIIAAVVLIAGIVLGSRRSDRGARSEP